MTFKAAKTYREWTSFIIRMFDKHERLSASRHLYDHEYVDEQTFLMLFGDAWQMSESLWRDEEIIQKTLTPELIERAMHWHLMTDADDVRSLVDMRPRVKVYRGGALENLGGMSWTTNRERAKFFAKRSQHLGPVYIAEGMAPKEKVFARFASRGEEEVVIDHQELLFYKVRQLKHLKEGGGSGFYQHIQNGDFYANPQVERASIIVKAQFAKKVGKEDELRKVMVEQINELRLYGFEEKVNQLQGRLFTMEQVFNGVLGV